MLNRIAKLTLEEKCALLQGWSTWTTRGVARADIPAIFLSDGPNGLRKQLGAADHLGLNESVRATCFPTAATVANSWNTALAEQIGYALGEEAAANDVHVLLGPGLNIKRSPLCGRNFEYFSEDPYLSGKLAASYVRGVQRNGISACPKHFAVNSQELRRMATDAIVDERTLREIYLTGFEIAVKEGAPRALMSSYNLINGTYANENAHLLVDILRNEWGFDGMVVTDWGGDNDHVAGIRNGSNLTMPAPGADAAIALVNAVRNGELDEAVIDARLAELLRVACETDAALKRAPKTYDADAPHALTREAARESVVLLENDGILPLHTTEDVAVIGDFASTPRYQGAGSSMVNPTRVDSFLDVAKEAGIRFAGFAEGFRRGDPKPDHARIAETVALAKRAKKVLLFIGLDEILESEGLDRTHMSLSLAQIALVDAVCAVNANVIYILAGGAPFVIPQNSACRAIVHGYLGGQGGAGALVDILLGRACPSGKLSETWPLSLADTPVSRYYPSRERTTEHREGLFVGYRYYDSADIPVRYPFGYGLSYTRFAYSDLSVSETEVSFTLKNVGSFDGAEIAQVYIGCENGAIPRPKRELKGFAKVFLKAGEQTRVRIPLDDKAFRYFNTRTDRWEIEGGRYRIEIGASICDIRLSCALDVHGTDAPLPAPLPAPYHSGHITNVSDEDFRALLGHDIPDGHWGQTMERNSAICQLATARSMPARLVCHVFELLLKRAERKGVPDLNVLFLYNMPLRAIGKMSGGAFSEQMVDDLVFLVNGHFWRGGWRIIRDFFRNQSASRAFIRKLEQSAKKE